MTARNTDNEATSGGKLVAVTGALRQRLADFGFVIGVLLLIVAPVLAALGWIGVTGSRPVTRVEVLSNLEFVPREQLMQVLGGELRRGFNGMDLSKMRDELQALPWVESASLRRVWPQRLQITLSEHIPIARWGRDGQLVSFSGELFHPRPESIPGDLPLLGGPEEAVDSVLEHYTRFADLLQVAGLGVDAVTVDSRGAWQVQLDNGLELLLGRHRMEQRLWRMARVFSAVVKPRLQNIRRVDLRYSNGFTVAWNGSGSA